MKILLYALFITLQFAVMVSSFAQSGSAEQKASQREQALAQLNDVNPLMRISVLEEILQSKDGILKTYAARKALASTDRDMRTHALRYAFSQGDRQYTFQVKECQYPRNGTSGCDHFLKPGQNKVPLYFDNMNLETGQFQVYSTLSNYKYVGGNRREYNSGMGRILNDNAEFDLELSGVMCHASLDKLENSSYSGTIYCFNGIVAIYLGTVDLF